MRQHHSEMRLGIFTWQDVEAMRHAYHLVMEDGTTFDATDDGEMLGRAIIRLYKMGLVDPQKLAEVAALMTSSKLFRHVTSHRCRSDKAVLTR